MVDFDVGQAEVRKVRGVGDLDPRVGTSVTPGVCEVDGDDVMNGVMISFLALLVSEIAVCDLHDAPRIVNPVVADSNIFNSRKFTGVVVAHVSLENRSQEDGIPVLGEPAPEIFKHVGLKKDSLAVLGRV